MTVRLPFLALALAVVLTSAACAEMPLPNDDADLPEAGQDEGNDAPPDEGGAPPDAGNPEGGADVPAV